MWYCISSDKNNKDFEKTFKVLPRKGVKKMKKFNLGDYDGKYVMHCQTEEEAVKFTEFLHYNGKKRKNGDSYLLVNNWRCYKEQTCYVFSENAFGTVDTHSNAGYTILKFSDFDWSEEKTKGDTERILKNFEEVTKILKGDEKMVGIGGEFRKVEFLNNDKVFSGKYEVVEIEIPRGLYDEFKEHTCTFKNCRTNVDDYSIREIFLLISEEVQEFNELVNKFNEKYEKKETLEELKEEYIKMASEYKFLSGNVNFKIRYDIEKEKYFVECDSIVRDIIKSHISLNREFTEKFCERMNKALERERKNEL